MFPSQLDYLKLKAEVAMQEARVIVEDTRAVLAQTRQLLEQRRELRAALRQLAPSSVTPSAQIGSTPHTPSPDSARTREQWTQPNPSPLTSPV